MFPDLSTSLSNSEQLQLQQLRTLKAIDFPLSDNEQLQLQQLQTFEAIAPQLNDNVKEKKNGERRK